MTKGQQTYHYERMDYYVAAIEHKERQKMADVGSAVDRRTFRAL